MKFELTLEYLENLRGVIERREEGPARQLMAELHPADIAEIYDELDMDEAKFLFLLLEGETASEVLAELDEDDRRRFLEALPSDVIAKQFINEMDSDDAADIIGQMTEQKRADVFLHLDDKRQAKDIVDLLGYHEDTAGGLMAKELIWVRDEWNMRTCIREMRRQAEAVDEVFYVYVVNENDELSGVLPLKRMLLALPETRVRDISEQNIISVTTDLPSQEVVQIMEKYNLVVLPVVDENRRLVGRITIDDVVDVLRDEAEEDYRRMSGLSEDVEPNDGVWMLTRARLPWLMVGLFGGVLGAQVISFYEGDLAKHAAMAFFIPLIAAMGGNVGVQSSAIVVQGLANNSIGLESTFRKILKEFAVAFINALACSSAILAYNLIFSDSLALTLSVSAALFVVIVFASVFGAFVPLTLNRFKIDPALATGPFITTVNDILGLFIYLAIGRMLFAVL